MKPVAVLIVLDGWGVGRQDASNPIYKGELKTFKWLGEHFPVTSLQASGISVGLPWGETSNSEVGHLTIGAGKIIYQYYPRIIMAIRDQSFFQNKALKQAFDHARKNNSAVNLVGLLTKGNVHASIEHMKALVDMGEKEKIPVKLHLFSDGKDTPPHSFDDYIRYVPKEKLTSLMGRYWAMDHNRNYRLTEQAYNALTGEAAAVVSDYAPTVKATYDKNMSEEYFPPMRFTKETPIKDGESIIFFNFREDGIRQLSEAFLLPNFDKFPVKKFENLHISTMTRYEEQFTAPVAFPPDNVSNPLGKVLADNGLRQLRLTETYKYAHVTYFFNGYGEAPYPNEYRILVPSLTVPHLNDRPELMAKGITDRAIAAIQDHSFDFILINYANGDMVAHTGDFDAGVKAAQVIDEEISRLIKVALSTAHPTYIFITSDHGNLEQMMDPMTGRKETQHDPNPVPFHIIGPGFEGRQFMNQEHLHEETLGILSDVAPTILKVLNIPKPPEMTGHNLLEKLL